MPATRAEKPFMQDAIDAYGMEAAMILCHSLIHDLRDASEAVPLLEPVTTITLPEMNRFPAAVTLLATTL